MPQIEATADIAVALGRLCDRLDRQDMARRARASEAYRQAEFSGTITLTAGAGTLQDFNRFGSPQGYTWSIRRLTAAGFTGGTLTAYKDSASGEPLAIFTGATTILPQYFGKGDILIKPMSQIVWSAASITGTVQVWGVADQVESWLLPSYIGGYNSGD